MTLIRNKDTRENKYIKKWDWLLILGLCLAPMTGFRIGKTGPGEVLCLIWGIKYLITKRYRMNDFLNFFSLLLVAMGLGSLTGMVIAPDELKISDLVTWAYLGVIAVSVSYGLWSNVLSYNEELLFVFAFAAVAWNVFLYLYGKMISQTFFGAPLWYGSGRRFSAGATNPHQVALLLCALIFIFLRCIMKKDRMVISVVGMILSAILLRMTESSTGIMAVALGFLVFLFFAVAHAFPKNRKKAMIILVIIVIALLLVGYSYFWNIFVDWIAKDKNGLGRFAIFSSFPQAFWRSPLIGMGPGIHGENGQIEFHNMYLEILVATGVIGGIIFSIFSVRIFKKMTLADWKLVPILVTLYSYGLAGFAMRRLVFWGITVFLVIIAEQMIESKKTSNKLNS